MFFYLSVKKDWISKKKVKKDKIIYFPATYATNYQKNLKHYINSLYFHISALGSPGDSSKKSIFETLDDAFLTSVAGSITFTGK